MKLQIVMALRLRKGKTTRLLPVAFLLYFLRFFSIALPFGRNVMLAAVHKALPKSCFQEVHQLFFDLLVAAGPCFRLSGCLFICCLSNKNLSVSCPIFQWHNEA